MLPACANQVEMVQWRAARFAIENYQRRSSATSVCEHLGWETQLQYRGQARLTMIYRIVCHLDNIPAEMYLAPIHLHGLDRLQLMGFFCTSFPVVVWHPRDLQVSHVFVESSSLLHYPLYLFSVLYLLYVMMHGVRRPPCRPNKYMFTILEAGGEGCVPVKQALLLTIPRRYVYYGAFC